MKKIMTVLSLLILVLLAACGSEEGEQAENGENNQKATIYTTVYPLEFVAQQIVGDKVEVESILPSGSDAHTYEPTTKEMVQMAEGEAFIYTKDEFEPYASTIAETLEEEGVPIIPVAEGLEEINHQQDAGHADEEGSTEEGHEGHNHSTNGEDPHIWLDPMIMTKVAENLKEELTAMYPEQEETFKENTETLTGKLKELDDQMGSTIQEADTKEVVVSHAAYGYWEEAYGLEQIAISGLSSTNEPSQKELEHVIEKAKEHGLGYVLFEKNVSPKAAEVVQEEIGAEPLYLHNLATRTEEEIDKDENYFDLMQKNIEVLEQALYEEDPA